MNQPIPEQTESTVRQVKEFFTQYSKLSETCFLDCVTDFTTRKVTNAEDTCSYNCLEKYIKITQRISQRFQEHQMQQAGGGLPDSMVKK